MEVLQRTANRGSISTASAYDIDNSLKLEPDNSEYLTKSQSNGNKTTWTCSFWFKRTELNDSDYPAFISASSSSWQTRISIFNDGRLWVDLGYGTSYYRNLTNLFLRDTSAWYHVVVAVDSTQGTASDRLNVYLNGELITSWNTQNYPAQNTEFKFFDSNHAMFIGTTTATDYRFAGYLAEMHVVDGTQLAQTDFGEFDDDSGIWKPKAYTGSYGSQGFYLDFKDSANLGDDASGNGNNFTENNISSSDQAVDSPSNNFQTFLSDGSLFNSGTNNITFSEGGTKFSKGSSTSWTTAYTNIAMTNGKWYMEFKNYSTGDNTFFGLTPVARTTSSAAQNYYTGQASDGSIGYYMANGQIYWQGSSSGGVTSATGDIIGVAVDIDNNKAYWHKNGTYMNSADPAAGSNGSAINDEPYFFACSTYNGSTSGETNTGGYSSFAISSAASDADGYGTFEYAPPSGFYALCTKNLAEYG